MVSNLKQSSNCSIVVTGRMRFIGIFALHRLVFLHFFNALRGNYIWHWVSRNKHNFSHSSFASFVHSLFFVGWIFFSFCNVFANANKIQRGNSNFGQTMQENQHREWAMQCNGNAGCIYQSIPQIISSARQYRQCQPRKKRVGGFGERLSHPST